MKEYANFDITGTLKSYREKETKIKYAFISVSIDKTTFINATVFAPNVDKLSAMDEGKQIRITGVIKSYKNNRTNEWAIGYTVHEIELINDVDNSDEEYFNDLNDTSPYFFFFFLPW